MGEHGVRDAERERHVDGPGGLRVELRAGVRGDDVGDEDRPGVVLVDVPLVEASALHG